MRLTDLPRSIGIKFLLYPLLKGDPAPEIDGEPIAVYVGGNRTKVSSQLQAVIYDHAHIPKVVQHWVSIGRFSESALKKIDGDASDDAMRGSSLEKRTWVMKQATGLMRVNKWMKRWGETESSACPRCGHTTVRSHGMCCSVPTSGHKIGGEQPSLTYGLGCLVWVLIQMWFAQSAAGSTVGS